MIAESLEVVYSTQQEGPSPDADALTAALTYAARGWPVFPVEPHGKAPHAGLAPHGLKDATTDPTIIRRWWAAVPNANVGVVTGATSGVWVLDADPTSDHPDPIAELQGKYAPLPNTPTSRTPSGVNTSGFNTASRSGTGPSLPPAWTCAAMGATLWLPHRSGLTASRTHGPKIGTPKAHP